MVSPNLLLTLEMLCKLLSISRRTLRSWVSQQILPAPLRLGPGGRTLRWHPGEVVDYLKKGQPNLAGPAEKGETPSGSR